MNCSHCGKASASVFFKQIVNNQVSELALCPDCAKKAASSAQGVSPVFDLLSGLGSWQEAPERRLARLQCPSCGLRYPEFRETGRLGCAECYEAFSEPLAEVLKHIHGSARHAGKSPSASSSPSRKEAPSSDLRAELDKAIREERFEDAARLRDRLKKEGR